MPQNIESSLTNYTYARLLFFSLLLMLGCNKVSKIPKEIIPINKMKQVLWDVIQADEFAAQYISKDTSKNLKFETVSLYNCVFSIHKISSLEFKKSIAFYKTHPLIQQILLDSLSQYATREREKALQKSNTILKSN